MKNLRFRGAIRALIITVVGMGAASKLLRMFFELPTGKNIPLLVLMIAVILVIPGWVFVKQNFLSR